jgi:hypothetical protein
MCGCVAIAANDRHARLRQAQLRSDNVNDSLLLAAGTVEGNAEITTVPFELRDLSFRNFVNDWQRAIMSRDAVIGGAHRQVRPPYLKPAFPQT